MCFGFALYFGFVGAFWEGGSSFLVGFGGFVGLGCFRGRFGCFMGASYVFWALGFLWVLSVVCAPCGFRVLGLILVGLFGFFFFVAWFWLFLCILSVYLVAPYAF
jgi:hypothetical protein